MTESKDFQSRVIAHAAELLTESRYVVGLTGAGVSVESGIPPFRGPGGLWTKLGEPSMNGYEKFLEDPKGYWERRLAPDTSQNDLSESLKSAKPNLSHYALVELEALEVLKCLITQNIDNLHREVGHKALAEIHGNKNLLRCIECNARYAPEEIPLEKLPPRCRHCKGIIKGDVVGFGEPIPSDVLQVCQQESARADCMIIAGTSATVYPAAAFPQLIKQRGGILIEVNLYESELTRICDVSLRGKSGEILPLLVAQVRELKAKGVTR